jgi:hypothetical protein
MSRPHRNDPPAVAAERQTAKRLAPRKHAILARRAGAKFALPARPISLRKRGVKFPNLARSTQLVGVRALACQSRVSKLTTDLFGERSAQGQSMIWRGFIAIPAIPLASCPGPITVLVAVASKGIPDGIMRGTNTWSPSEASFNVSNGKLSCGGSYKRPRSVADNFDTGSLQRWPRRHHYRDTRLWRDERRRDLYAH